MRTHGRYIRCTQNGPWSWRHNRCINNWGLTHSSEFPLFHDRNKTKNLLSLPEEGHPFSCTPKDLKAMRKTRLSLSKRQQSPQRTHLPPAVSERRKLPLDSKWRCCSVAKQPKQLLRTLIACVLLPALTLLVSNSTANFSLSHLGYY